MPKPVFRTGIMGWEVQTWSEGHQQSCVWSPGLELQQGCRAGPRGTGRPGCGRGFELLSVSGFMHNEPQIGIEDHWKKQPGKLSLILKALESRRELTVLGNNIKRAFSQQDSKLQCCHVKKYKTK